MRLALLILSLLLVSGCQREPSKEANPEFAVRTLVAQAPVTLWTDASTAKLFVEAGRTPGGAATFVEPDGRLMTAAERRTLEAHFTADSYRSGADEAAACFIPHHFVRYYSATGAQIGELAICFCCKGVLATPSLDLPIASGADEVELSFDEQGLGDLIRSWGYRTDIEC